MTHDYDEFNASCEDVDEETTRCEFHIEDGEEQVDIETICVEDDDEVRCEIEMVARGPSVTHEER